MRTQNNELIPVSSMIPFLLMAFGLAWGILALFIFLPEFATELFGNLTGQHPLFYLGVYSPAIAAFVIVGYYGGYKGIQLFLSRILLWRCSVAWYTFLFIVIPLVFYIGAAIKGTLWGNLYPFDSILALFSALLFAAIKGPIEEFGWRGFALPLLQRKFTPIWASLILGVIWGIWHFPVFLLSGTQQSNWSFAPFFVGCLAISVIVTALFNASRGSIFLAALFHFMLMNPIFPDAQPYDTYLLVIITIPIVWFNRKLMFSREKSVVEIIPSLSKTDRAANKSVEVTE